MQAKFIANTDMKSIEKDVLRWSTKIRLNHLYSMAEIAREIYEIDYATDEFWRVSTNIGPAITSIGFKKVYWKNKRYWVKND